MIAELTGVTKRFGATTALDSVDLAVNRGDVLALLGPNGAGKSTAIAILLGLRVPDSGSAALYGYDPRSAEARRRVGVTPQETAFPPTLRVDELVALVRRHYASPAAHDALCDRFGLEPIRRRQTGGLSGGERRLVAVALAFAGAPELVVLDEPTTSLDVHARRRVWEAIRAHADAGGSVLLTTHQLEEADALAQRAVLLDGGRVVESGPIAAIKAAAGLTHVSFRAPSGERVRHAVADGGVLVEGLVRQGIRLCELEVRPLTLEEALEARR